MVSCSHDIDSVEAVEQISENENTTSDRSLSAGCTSNTSCVDESWCNCHSFNYPGSGTGTIPCTYTLQNKCQASEALADNYKYATWPQLNGICTNVTYLDEGDCGFTCCLFANEYVGRTYADICSDLTQSMNAWVECYLDNINSVLDCPDCLITSYQPHVVFDFDPISCNTSICIEGMYIECCN